MSIILINFDHFCSAACTIRDTGWKLPLHTVAIYCYIKDESIKDLIMIHHKFTNLTVIEMCCEASDSQFCSESKLGHYGMVNIDIEYLRDIGIEINIRDTGILLQSHNITNLAFTREEISCLIKSISDNQLALDHLKNMWKFLFGHV